MEQARMDKLTRMLDKFVEANRFVKQICPENWRKQMAVYRLMIADRMRGEGMEHNVVEAAIVLAAQYSDTDNTRMWIYATAVEMIEEG
jgi:predicted GNAT family N-acyltransferase